MSNPQTISMSVLFLFQILFITCVTSYTPNDNFLVNCGNSGNSPSIDGRNWIGDIDSEQFSPEYSSNSKTAKAVGKTIPYNTARLSRSEFSYLFTVNSDGQKFIRLYFYPSSYNPDFLRSDSLFSVRVGPHTLLKDFNASFAAHVVGKEVISKEYCVNVYPEDSLRLTFTPSLSHPNAYAFINGIEVISMPTSLYYTNPENPDAMMLNGGSQQYQVKNNSALETLYRINVGGSQIPPQGDTGMFRQWEEDVPYLEKERPHSVSAGSDLTLNYKNYPNYTAPDYVYLTARNYGANATAKYNVTWVFQVDSSFTYMVRLHFCEFDQQIQLAGQRVFQIFIADILVEGTADVVLWSGNSIPLHKDYVVSMRNQGSQKKMIFQLSCNQLEIVLTEMCY